MDLKDLFYLDGSLLKVKDVSKLREAMDDLIYDAVFTEDDIIIGVRVIFELLPIRFKEYEIAGGQHLNVHHAPFRASQAAIRPLDKLDGNSHDFIQRNF